MTHDDRVLGLLSDGQPHSHSEVYDLHVVAHSRVASLRRKGHRIECWRDGDTYWYRLLGERTDASPGMTAPAPTRAVPLAEQPDGQYALDFTAAA